MPTRLSVIGVFMVSFKAAKMFPVDRSMVKGLLPPPKAGRFDIHHDRRFLKVSVKT